MSYYFFAWVRVYSVNIIRVKCGTYFFGPSFILQKLHGICLLTAFWTGICFLHYTNFFVFLSKHAAAFYRVCQTQYVPVTSIRRRNKKHGSANSFPVLGVRIFYLSTWMEWTWRMLLHELWHLQNTCLRRSGVERGDIWNKMFICVSLIIFICTP